MKNKKGKRKVFKGEPVAGGIAIGDTASVTFANNIAIGTNTTTGNQGNNVAIGTSATIINARQSVIQLGAPGTLSNSSFSIQGHGIFQISGNDANASTTGFFILRNLRQTDPGAGSDQFWVDTADGNRVKYGA